MLNELSDREGGSSLFWEVVYGLGFIEILAALLTGVAILAQ